MTNKIKVIIFCQIIFICVIFETVSAQTDTLKTLTPIIQKKPFNIGIVGGGNYIWNKTSLPLYTGSPECGTYSNGRDIGYYAGIDGGYAIFDSLLFISGRILYDNRPITLTQETQNYQVLNPATKKYEPLVRKYNYDGKLQYIILDAGFRIQPFSSIPIFLRVSFDAGNPLVGADVNNSEQIVSPAGFLYPDNTKKQTIETGKLNSAHTTYGVSGGLQGEINITKDLYFVPEISYRHALNSVVSDNQWKMNMVRAGIGLTWKFGLESTPTPKKLDTIKKEEKKAEPPPIVEKHAVIKQFDAGSANIDETIVTQTYPLLPYIFFDSAGSNIRNNYITNDIPKATFSEALLPKETLGIYYHLLDIIGLRLKENPKAKLTITGTTDGEELADADSRIKLADSRANAVADYLIKNWEIPKDRLIIKSENFPKLPTSKVYREGYEENRRVELSSNSPQILRPIVHSRFNEYTSSQPDILLNIKSDDLDNVNKWSIALVTKDNRIIKSVAKEGVPPGTLSLPLERNFINNLAENSTNNDTVYAVLNMIEKKGNVIESKTIVPVVKSQNQFEVGRLNLIVFDFDRFDISQVNKDMIVNFIENSIQNTSSIWIKGSTDRLGEMNYNVLLSNERAKSVRDYLLDIRPHVTIKEVKGIGASTLPYDNNLPEGRFYCRTVLIEVKTPLEKEIK